MGLSGDKNSNSINRKWLIGKRERDSFDNGTAMADMSKGE
jgi:hypothetical protein